MISKKILRVTSCSYNESSNTRLKQWLLIICGLIFKLHKPGWVSASSTSKSASTVLECLLRLRCRERLPMPDAEACSFRLKSFQTLNTSLIRKLCIHNSRSLLIWWGSNVMTKCGVTNMSKHCRITNCLQELDED